MKKPRNDTITAIEIIIMAIILYFSFRLERWLFSVINLKIPHWSVDLIFVLMFILVVLILHRLLNKLIRDRAK